MLDPLPICATYASYTRPLKQTTRTETQVQSRAATRINPQSPAPTYFSSQHHRDKARLQHRPIQQLKQSRTLRRAHDSITQLPQYRGSASQPIERANPTSSTGVRTPLSADSHNPVPDTFAGGGAGIRQIFRLCWSKPTRCFIVKLYHVLLGLGRRLLPTSDGYTRSSGAPYAGVLCGFIAVEAEVLPSSLCPPTGMMGGMGMGMGGLNTMNSMGGGMGMGGMSPTAMAANSASPMMQAQMNSAMSGKRVRAYLQHQPGPS